MMLPMQQLNTRHIFGAVDDHRRHDLNMARAWGQAKPRTPQEIDIYVTNPTPEHELIDHYQCYYAHDGLQ